MDTSVFIAKIAAATYLSVGLGALMNRNYLKSVVEDFMKSPGAAYLGTFFALSIGGVLLYNHSTWTADWKVLITILGWGGIIKGVTGLMFPDFLMHKLSSRIMRYSGFNVIAGVICIALGLVFGYFGFMA